MVQAAATLATSSATPLLSLTSLQSHAAPTVHVQPLAVLSILHHYIRRPEGQQHVVGTLMGVRAEDGSTIEIRSSFAVPYAETDGERALDTDHHRTMADVHVRASGGKEQVVGWYCTGASVDAAEGLAPVNEFYMREVGARSQLVHLLVDPALGQGAQSGDGSDGELMRAYTAVPVGGLPGLYGSNSTAGSDMDDAVEMGAVSGTMFFPLPCKYQVQADEKAGLTLMSAAKATADDCTPHSAVTQAPLLADMDRLRDALYSTRTTLSAVLDHVRQVNAGTRPMDTATGRFLMDTVISGVPRFDREHFEKLMQGRVQDVLMVVYLANLTRAQLAIAKRLQKRVGGSGEEEEEEGGSGTGAVAV